MANTGPPYYATDAAEAARAQAHTVSASRRRAFRAQLQARFRGNAAEVQRITNNWMPIIQRKDDQA